MSAPPSVDVMLDDNAEADRVLQQLSANKAAYSLDNVKVRLLLLCRRCLFRKVASVFVATELGYMNISTYDSCHHSIDREKSAGMPIRLGGL